MHTYSYSVDLTLLGRHTQVHHKALADRPRTGAATGSCKQTGASQSACRQTRTGATTGSCTAQSSYIRHVTSRCSTKALVDRHVQMQHRLL
jgi:hypothetical protein